MDENRVEVACKYPHLDRHVEKYYVHPFGAIPSLWMWPLPISNEQYPFLLPEQRSHESPPLQSDDYPKQLIMPYTVQ